MAMPKAISKSNRKNENEPRRRGAMSQDLYEGFHDNLVHARNLGLITAVGYCYAVVRVLTTEIPPQSLPGGGCRT